MNLYNIKNVAIIANMFSNYMQPILTLEDRRDELRQQWKDTKSMPRKMKKRRRKEILVDWELNEMCNVSYTL